MGGLCKERCEEGRRLEEEDRRQRWVETLAGEMVKKRKRETDKTIQKVTVHEIRQYRIK